MTIIRVLLVDDEKDLLEATKQYIEKQDSNIQIITANSASTALEKLTNEPIDLIISDYQMPQMNGLEFLAEVREREYNTPFIIFTGRGREEVAIQALNLGADYYLQKGGDVVSQFTELLNLINKSIDKQKADIALRKSEEKFSKAFRYSFNLMSIYRLSDKVILDVNDNFTKSLNYFAQEVKGKKISDLMFWAKDEDFVIFEKQLLESFEVKDFETVFLASDSRIIPVQVSATLIDIEGDLCVLSVARDISELTQALEALKENETRYRILFDESPIPFFKINLFDMKLLLKNYQSLSINELIEKLYSDANLLAEIISKIKIVEINKKGLEFIGSKNKEFMRLHFKIDQLMKNFQMYTRILSFLISGESTYEDEFTIYDLNDKKLHILLRISIAPGSEENWSKVLLSIVNITDRRRAEFNLDRERKIIKIIADASVISKDADDLCNRVLKGLIDTMQFDFGTIRLYDKKTNQLKPFTIIGIDDIQKEYIRPLSLDNKNHLLIQRLLEKEIFFVENIVLNGYGKDSTLFKNLGAKAYIFCPLLDSTGKILGSMQIGSKSVKEIAESDKIFFQTIANMFSIILDLMLQNKQL